MSGVSGSGDEVPDDANLRAGEYVLGVLDPRDAAAVRRDAMTDLDLADAIVRWEVQLAPLATVIAPVQPPGELWARIESAAAASDRANVVAFRRGGRVWSSVAVWRSATAAALALAAVLAIVAFLPRASPPVQVAALVPLASQGPAAFVARVSADGSVVLSSIAPAAIPADRDLELWLKRPGAAPPISLGVLPASGRTVNLPGATENGAQLLVSLEPRGGSPTGQPTGPVIYGGALTRG